MSSVQLSANIGEEGFSSRGIAAQPELWTEFQVLMWVQGMRAHDDVPSVGAYWAEVLYLRLTAQLDRVGSGAATLASERILELERSSYFYVGRCFPDFGDLVVAHKGRSRRIPDQPYVTPFDTGGLAHDHIVTNPTLSDAEKAHLVRETSHRGNAYWRPLRRWIDSSFAALTSYVLGEPPTTGSVSVIDIEGSTDSRAWSWEGRLRSRPYSQHPMKPVRVIVAPLKRREYVDWVRQQGALGRRHAAAHIDMAFRIFEEASEPVTTMEAFLMKGRSRGTR